jgi:recombinational DNA repair protein RecT
MALIGNCIPAKNDVFFDFPAAYARVLSVTSENVANAVTFIKVEIHADQTARQAQAVPVVGRLYNAPTVDLPPDEDPIRRGYLWLKTQPDFAGWIDS